MFCILIKPVFPANSSTTLHRSTTQASIVVQLNNRVMTIAKNGESFTTNGLVASSDYLG